MNFHSDRKHRPAVNWWRPGVWCAFLAMSNLALLADEGMWLLPRIEEQPFPRMQAMGLRLQPVDLFSNEPSGLSQSVVLFDGGCTGEIISPQGLLLTNLHCGF